MSTRCTLIVALALAVQLPMCRKQPPASNNESTHPLQGASDPGPTTAAADVSVTDTFVAPPAGPHASVQGEHAELNATLTAPAAVPGQGTLEVVLQSKDGYHVNELDEVQLMLEGTATTVRPELARTDATEADQNHLKFVIPAAISAAGASVHGRIRFSVCAEVCIRQRLAFDVALR
jgi:hypothetical protein